MSTTTDLRNFGYTEIELASVLLSAYCENPPDYLSSNIMLMMNRMSGNVFLTDEDCNVAMMNGDKLDAWLFTPYHGHEGFIDELVEYHNPQDLHAEDLEFIRHWAEVLHFELPKEWEGA